MMVAMLMLAVSMQSPALQACASGFDTSALEQCRGDSELTSARAAPKGTSEQHNHWQAAADHYRKAVDSTASGEVKARLLSMIADLYEKSQLNDANQLEQTLRELIRYAGKDLLPTFRLARLEEDRGSIDEAENTLLEARRLQPDEIEPYKMLAQFYARRATAFQQMAVIRDNSTKDAAQPGTPDANGVYRVGNGVTPPRRFGSAAYPPEAQAAGIAGSVEIEVTLDEQGIISDARVIRSIPLLDDAALKAVREWRYDPVTVNGKAVPARMTVTVNFSVR